MGSWRRAITLIKIKFIMDFGPWDQENNRTDQHNTIALKYNQILKTGIKNFRNENLHYDQGLKLL